MKKLTLVLIQPIKGEMFGSGWLSTVNGWVKPVLVSDIKPKNSGEKFLYNGKVHKLEEWQFDSEGYIESPTVIGILEDALRVEASYPDLPLPLIKKIKEGELKDSDTVTVDWDYGSFGTFVTSGRPEKIEKDSEGKVILI